MADTNQGGLTPTDYKMLVELLDELRWLRIIFVTFIPKGGKERKLHETRLKDMTRLKELCEQEVLK